MELLAFPVSFSTRFPGQGIRHFDVDHEYRNHIEFPGHRAYLHAGGASSILAGIGGRASGSGEFYPPIVHLEWS
jgi:hypothetical protein